MTLTAQQLRQRLTEIDADERSWERRPKLNHLGIMAHVLVSIYEQQEATQVAPQAPRPSVRLAVRELTLGMAQNLFKSEWASYLSASELEAVKKGIEKLYDGGYVVIEKEALKG